MPLNSYFVFVISCPWLTQTAVIYLSPCNVSYPFIILKGYLYNSIYYYNLLSYPAFNRTMETIIHQAASLTFSIIYFNLYSQAECSHI